MQQERQLQTIGERSIGITPVIPPQTSELASDVELYALQAKIRGFGVAYAELLRNPGQKSKFSVSDHLPRGVVSRIEAASFSLHRRVHKQDIILPGETVETDQSRAVVTYQDPTIAVLTVGADLARFMKFTPAEAYYFAQSFASKVPVALEINPGVAREEYLRLLTEREEGKNLFELHSLVVRMKALNKIHSALWIANPDADIELLEIPFDISAQLRASTLMFADLFAKPVLPLTTIRQQMFSLSERVLSYRRPAGRALAKLNQEKTAYMRSRWGVDYPPLGR